MFKTTQDLKEFFLWCLQNGIESVKVQDVEVKFSNIAFLDKIASNSAVLEEKSTSKTLVDTLTDAEDEELLTWSSR